MSTSDSAQLLADAERLLPDLVEIRRRIHRTPELGLNLPQTQATVLEEIDGLGLDPHTGDSVSSVVADLAMGEGPVVLLRGDIFPPRAGDEIGKRCGGTLRFILPH